MIEIRGLNEFKQNCESIISSSQSDRRTLHNRIGIKMMRVVEGEIAASGVENPSHVAARQKVYVGAGGGYVAVRAKDGSTGSNSDGAITNYLENGHRIVFRRFNSNLAVGYYEKNDTGRRTRAFSFYKSTEQKKDAIARTEYKRFERELANRIERGGKQ